MKNLFLFPWLYIPKQGPRVPSKAGALVLRYFWNPQKCFSTLGLPYGIHLLLEPFWSGLALGRSVYGYGRWKEVRSAWDRTPGAPSWCHALVCSMLVSLASVRCVLDRCSHSTEFGIPLWIGSPFFARAGSQSQGQTVSKLGSEVLNCSPFSHTAWVLIVVLPFSSCAPLSNLLNVPLPQFIPTPLAFCLL